MDRAIIKRFSYLELNQRITFKENDQYHIISDYLTDSLINCLLANPNLHDLHEDALNVVIYNNSIVGRNVLMPTKLKIGDNCIHAQSGGGYEISEQFQGLGLGSMAFRESIFNSKYATYIGQLYSSGASYIVDKLGLVIFKLPNYFKVCHTRPILEAYGIRGIPLKLLSSLLDFGVKTLSIPNRIRLIKLYNKYSIDKVTHVPDWVNQMTVLDGHKYMEIHDREWLQWCLDYRFTDCNKDMQSFYVVYDKKGNPKGFFMTKVRFEDKQGKYHNVTRGTVVEWGSNDENELSEIDLNLMAINTFGTNVDTITTVLSNTNLASKIIKLGFVRHGDFEMSINPGVIENEDITNQNSWRIRYGGCNTIVL